MSEPKHDIKDVNAEPPPTTVLPKEAIPEEVQKKAQAMIPVTAGLLMPLDQLQLGAFLKQIADGEGFPEQFGTAAKRLAAYSLSVAMMGREQWQLALNNMAFIKNKLCIYGEMPGTLAERTGQVAEKHVFVIDKDYKKISTENKNLDAEVYAGVCQIQRKGREKKEFFYTMDEAKKAGQYPPKKKDGSINMDSPWEKHKKIMLMRKAMAAALKFEFPECLVGVPIAEYDFDEAPDIKDVTPSRDRASELNSRFAAPPVDPAPAATV